MEAETQRGKGSVMFVVQSKSYPTLCNPWAAARQASLSFTISWGLPKLMSIELVMPSNYLILCCLLLLLSYLQFFSASGSFPMSWLFIHIRWPGGFSSSPSNEYSGLISFRVDLLAVHRILESLLQHHNSKASVLQHSTLFMVQPSNL